jgi:L-fucose mutarotase/ribose pyranase (RbsD/FucU family)
LGRIEQVKENRMSPMRRTMLRRAHAARDQVVERLSQAQFVHPHRPLRRALLALDGHQHQRVVDATLSWLKLDPEMVIGRLRRTELVQLARCLDRMARQHAVATVV